ncbi:MAG: T9SS type A sorting domain-containing protein [candidate division WOR-3 bacterium]|nr:T9SS type A sorting domain-containing protein [candidate division WOR-3 bacterium]
MFLVLTLNLELHKKILERKAYVESQIQKLNKRRNQLDFYRQKFNTLQLDTITVCILAIRVEFQKEEPDDPLTTGNGTFDTTSYGAKGTFEYKPPYDSLYFLSILEFSKNYFLSATYNRIKFKYSVSPIVKVPHKIRYYGDLNFFAQGITSFFRDAIRSADQKGVFSQPSAYCNPQAGELIFRRIAIFYAGSAYQTDINGDSPYDIPALTLFAGALEYYLNEPYIVVNNGNDTIYDGTLLPQTLRQDGINVGLEGTVIHELNHLIFFVDDLYDYSGLGTGAGYFDIMGTGGYGGDIDNIPEGYLPTLPGAYTKLYMDSIFNLICPSCQRIIMPNEIMNILPSEVEQVLNTLPSSFYPQFYKIPFDNKEYLLLEFRKREKLMDNKVEFIWNSDSSLRFGIKDNEWDYALPGEGILIWHVDRNIIDSFRIDFQSNRPMGVSIIEADGIPDFQYFIKYPEGWKGSKYDLFYSPHKNIITSYTYPSLKSNEDKITGFEIYDISSVSSSMNFKIKNSILWKVYFGNENYKFQRQLFIREGNIVALLFDGHLDTLDKTSNTISIYSELYLFKKNGESYYNQPLVKTFSQVRDFTFYPFLFKYPPLIADFNNNGTYEVYMGNTDGKIYSFIISNTFSNNYIQNFNFPIRSCLRKFKNYILFGTDEGKVFLFEPITRTVYKSNYLGFPISTCFQIKNDTIYLQGIDGVFYMLNDTLGIIGKKELEILPKPIEVIPIVLKDRIYTLTNNYLWILDKSLNILNQVKLKSRPINLSYYKDGILVITRDGIYKYSFEGALMGYINEKMSFSLSSDNNIIFNSFLFNYSKSFSDLYPIITDSIFAYSDIKNNIYFWRFNSNEIFVASIYDYRDISDFKIPKKIKPMVYPNPVRKNEKFTVRFYAEELKTYKIKIFDFSGRIVFERDVDVKMKGINDILVDNNFKAGAYIVDINGERAKFYLK